MQVTRNMWHGLLWLETGIVGHMSHQAVRGRVLRIARHELLLVFPLKEGEDSRPVADNLQVSIVHGQLTESQDSAMMIDVSGRGQRWMQRSGPAPGGKSQMDGV